MKNVCILFFLVLFNVGNAQIINFPDPNFKNALVNTKCVDTDGDNKGDADADLNNDGEIDVSEALKVMNLQLIERKISDLNGIVHFKNLTYLDCNSFHTPNANKITSLNVQGMTNLEVLNCINNQITSLNVQGLMNLKVLDCTNNQLTSINVEGLINLEDLQCETNQIASLNVQGLKKLKNLQCGTNQIASLNVQGLYNLEILNCTGNQITSINAEGLTNLEVLACHFNKITSLNVQGLTNLKLLYCYNNQLSTLSVQKLTNLETLSCNKNQITSLNVEGLTNLKELNCVENKITSLNIQGLTNMEILSCNKNQITSLNVEGLTNLKNFDCSENKITSLKIQGLTNLESLSCSRNLITLLIIEGLTNLKELKCGNNKITSLNVDEFKNLENLSCYGNQISFLNVEDLTNLKALSCSENKITSLNIQRLTNLENLYCDKNQITSLDVEGLINLKNLNCRENKITKLDISKLNKLELLFCNNNQITSLNGEGLKNLHVIDCFENQLISIFIKGAKLNTRFSFYGNSNLNYICCDEEKILEINSLVISNGQNCEVNSYCTFTPGGKFYNLNGENIFDRNNNDCDDQDIKKPNVKINITNGTISGTFISNSTGNFNIPFQEGTHTITPILENLDHFEVSPSSYTVTFPSTADTITQNFCITPKGILRQTNITVIPLSPPARPGFEAKYKIVWENVGNQIESGTLNFTYDETLLDYISATQTADQVADGIIKWNFSNLLPFEKREITVTLKVNRPTDTPAVNAGDKLYLTASILDNIFTLENTVVGSYDPNDKTCLQGDRVHPDMIGKYVDYLIRFENTGTYAAENVVVKDIIDTKRYDVSTLQITDASHEVYTRIEGNKVEFIFENIQLPFDDANNDGYIAFKIKTLSTLQLGDSLKNLADIYFDYNFPIRTNEAQTTVALPSFTQDWISDINVYPNPVLDILFLQTEETWAKAEIFDVSGRIMRAVSLSSQSIDVSSLESGTYFVRLRNGDRVGRVKFVKM